MTANREAQPEPVGRLAHGDLILETPTEPRQASESCIAQASLDAERGPNATLISDECSLADLDRGRNRESCISREDLGGYERELARLPEWDDGCEPWAPGGGPVDTTDPDARSGHRSYSNRRKAGPYVGYNVQWVVEGHSVTDGAAGAPAADASEPPTATMLTLTPATSEHVTGAGLLRAIVWDRGHARRSMDLMIDGPPFAPFVPVGLMYGARSRVESFGGSLGNDGV